MEGTAIWHRLTIYSDRKNDRKKIQKMVSCNGLKTKEIIDIPKIIDLYVDQIMMGNYEDIKINLEIGVIKRRTPHQEK